LGSFDGFIAQPWMEGQRLQPTDAKDPAILSHLGRYLAARAGPILPLTAAQAGLKRLADILYWNIREACGERLAARAQAWVESLPPAEPGPSYSDGRMAPHEWLYTPDGRLLKTDSTGHQFDHTCVGEQSLLWDVAGVVVEWNLESAAPLLRSLRAAGIQNDSRLLLLHQMAYAAFRLGVCSLFASQDVGTEERGRLERAAEYYRHSLSRWLTTA
ncbi:MAG TPA: hypothetical protein VNT26_13230, partial [Candidatus Sulfotelmatobacter sp.]|nr:hypothetical protein [Candidatus Sulfotelmatobacter sp.]